MVIIIVLVIVDFIKRMGIIEMSESALCHLMRIYKKEWWDMSLREQMDALEQYIYGEVRK